MVTVAPPPRLAELALAHGVATEYWDWQGRHVTVSAATIRSVLTALGVRAEGDADGRARVGRRRARCVAAHAAGHRRRP